MPLVLTHKHSSNYDDVPEERYHFPETYRNLIHASEGEWFIYYEPRRDSGRESYVALARLGTMWSDEKLPGHYYVGVSEFEEFTNPVPWRANDLVLESGLQKEDGSTNKGQFGRSVRALPHGEFNAIVEQGFAGAYEAHPVPVPSAADGEMPIVERRVVEMVVQRTVRERVFTTNVRTAYTQTCAFTGWRVVNGGGWTEMEAAHIRPVEHNGPDSVRNGLALSRTMHALFDRGFLTLSDDYRIIESTKSPLPAQLRALLVPGGKALVPAEMHLQPHRSYLEFHRQSVFKDR